MKVNRRKSRERSSVENDVEGFLANQRMIEVESYLSRGRSRSHLSDGALIEAWVHAMRDMATQPHLLDRRLTCSDLSAEIELRGLSAPYEMVKDASDELITKATEAYGQLLKDPAELNKANEELQADIDKFKSLRDRPKN